MVARSSHSSPSGTSSAIRWPLIISMAAVGCFLIVASTARETYREWKVDQEIEGLRTQVEQLEGKRLSLVDTLARLNSDETLDREARLRLGMRKPGERVIILEGMEQKRSMVWQDELSAASATSSALSLEHNHSSNPRKWMAYFFHF